MATMILKSIIRGFIGTTALLAVYFTIVSLISGWSFALSQFSQFWYFILGLAAGFGVQIGLYSYLKDSIRQNVPKGVVAVSGTTSTVAMISCCAHYLANLLPVIGISGVLAIIGQYQIELFWFGLIANAAGIGYIASRILKFSRS
ncbi:MAG: hypothetical protein WC840_01340 [Candidatus Peribacteraceae bacterium]